MLSAVENFNSAAAAATHAYVHHNPYAIAAAAAAADTAAAAAASVKPLQQATALEQHHHHRHHHMLSHSSLANAGILLPPAQLTALPSPEGTGSRILASSQLSIHNKLNSNNNSLVAPGAIAMSSAEFVRPHPRQPRYNSSSSSSSSNNNNNNSSSNTNNNTNTNSNINNVSNNNNNNGSSNGIPLHLRNNKIGNSCVNSAQSPRKKYSTEQLGPVNLVTSNNNNLNNNGGGNSSINSTSSPPIKSPSSEQIQQSPNEIMAEVYAYHQYNRLLAANRSIYSDPSLYSGHHQITRNHSLPTYLPDQFPGYLHHPPSSRAYSPPESQSSLLRPPQPPPLPTQQQQQMNLGSSHTASSLLNNSHNNSTTINNNNNNNNNVNTSLCTTQLPVMPDRHPHLSVSIHHNNNNNTSHLPQQSSLGSHTDRHQFLSSHAKEKDPKNIDYINSKANSADFKVPSGREGSLKHRFLPRQYAERDNGRRRSPIAATVLRNSSNSNAPTNFTKGSLIELITGELRRVEDMRTEDFIQSAERSQHLELADSTVVKICNTPHSVMITFSYNKNRSKVDIDASVEHPFFVYGQGWASCNPELSLKAYGLKCRPLQVGDVCISLKPRESSSYATTPRSPTTYTQPAQQYKEDMTPQNLSRKSSISQASTVPTTATGTAVSSRLSVPMPSHLPPQTSIMSHLPVQPYDMLQSYGTSPPAPTHQHHLSPHQQHPQQHPHHHQHHLQRQQKADGRFIVTRHNGDHQASPSPPSNQTSRPPSNQPYYLGTSAIDKSVSSVGSGSLNSAELSHSTNSDHEAAIDASTSRKRRWSWSDPVNVCDEDGQPPPHKNNSNS